MQSGHGCQDPWEAAPQPALPLVLLLGMEKATDREQPEPLHLCSTLSFPYLAVKVKGRLSLKTTKQDLLPGTAPAGRAVPGTGKQGSCSKSPPKPGAFQHPPSHETSVQVSACPHHGSPHTEFCLWLKLLQVGGRKRRGGCEGDLVTASMSLKGFSRGREQACPGSLDPCGGRQSEEWGEH